MTTSDLITEINNSITTNSTNQITGAILRGVLTDMVNTLANSGKNYFLFPNDTLSPVSATTDIGKLAMNDGSGTAKVYALTPASTSIPGSWNVSLTQANWGGLSSTSAISISQLDGTNISIDQVMWRSGATPASPLAELTLIKAAIDAHDLGLTVVLVDSNNMTITEPSYLGMIISTNNMPNDSFTVLQLSVPPSPIAPTAFPLGKILDVQGSNVLISSAAVETYTLDGTVTLTESYYNTANYTSYNYNDPDGTAFISALHFFAVPSNGGLVTYFDPTVYNLDNTFVAAFRHQELGLILSADNTNHTVTVFHMQGLSPILNFFLKAIWAGQQSY